MKLQTGKTYKTRDGKRFVTIKSIDPDYNAVAKGVYYSEADDGVTQSDYWFAHGGYYIEIEASSPETPFDLVEEVEVKCLQKKS